MKVVFRESFLRDARNLKDKTISGRIKAAIEGIEQAQTLLHIPGLKKLKGGGEYYRLRVGDHRLGLIVELDTVIFIRLLHRKEIYRYFP